MKNKIRINQLGYITHMPKRAAIIGGGNSFEIVSADSNIVVYTGTLPKAELDAASGDRVSAADFSGFSMRGRFYIRCGRKVSDVFPISDNPFSPLKNMLLKAFYYNRCTETTEAFAGDFAHPACHASPALIFSNPGRTADLTGGWHDSGSYNKYTVTTCVALAHMLNAFIIFPDTFSDKVSIPESGGILPDVLNECKWGLDWLLKMQTPDGGVFHKVCSLNISGTVTPENDDQQQYAFSPSHQATTCFTAVCALAAGVFARYDTDFSDLLQSAAFNGWIWLTNHPVYKPFVNPDAVKYTVMGDLPDDSFHDSMFWAVCELYAMTGEKLFADKINCMYKIVNATGFTVGSAGGFGAVAYLRCHQARSMEIERALRLQFRIEADNIYSVAQKSGYDTALTSDEYTMGSNLKLMTGAITLITAYMLLHCNDYIRTAAEQFNYILGKNPLGMAFVTGLGENSVQNPHHRPSAFDEIDEPVPGMVVVGPNKDRSDDFARWNIPHGTPPAKCYYDIGFCFSTNEASIVCNSAALFITAFFDSRDN